ncbi:hypothetical protein [Halarchaeum sp. P4]|uniref:hypothetical protein n=1 Tax=Halarchaeum sp. P4 TaxID=3421639 RepID=UPI003EBFD4EF
MSDHIPFERGDTLRVVDTSVSAGSEESNPFAGVTTVTVTDLDPTVERRAFEVVDDEEESYVLFLSESVGDGRHRCQPADQTGHLAGPSFDSVTLKAE